MSALKFHNSREIPVHRLPFVGPVQGMPGFSFWAVPKTGGYIGGCRTGEALAALFLQHLRKNGGDPGASLQHIVLDMLDLERSDCPEDQALRGQVVGFFSVLEGWLAGATKHFGHNLELADPQILLDRANAGLELDEEAYLAALEEAEKEEEEGVSA